MQQRYRLAALLLTLNLSACGGSETTNNVDLGLGNGAEQTTEAFPNDIIDDSNVAQQAPEPVACATPPANGATLDGQRFSGDGHELEIRNGTSGDAIIKIRNADTNQLVTAFFVAQNNNASVSGIPDGNYYFQYAFGAPLAEDCKSFVTITSANRFPDQESFVTERIETADGTRLRSVRVAYTLYPVPEGNIHPTPINAEEFNR